MLDEKLITIDKLVIVEGDWVGLGAWETLEMTANVGDDVDKLFELLDAFHVDFVWFWPILDD